MTAIAARPGLGRRGSPAPWRRPPPAFLRRPQLSASCARRAASSFARPRRRPAAADGAVILLRDGSAGPGARSPAGGTPAPYFLAAETERPPPPALIPAPLAAGHPQQPFRLRPDLVRPWRAFWPGSMAALRLRAGCEADEIRLHPRRAPPVGFLDALLAGLAPDGGLYVPEAWPQSDGRRDRRLRRPALRRGRRRHPRPLRRRRDRSRRPAEICAPRPTPASTTRR